MTLEELESEAADQGIETYEYIRKVAIEIRNASMGAGSFDQAVLMTHIIWWLSSLKEALD